MPTNNELSIQIEELADRTEDLEFAMERRDEEMLTLLQFIDRQAKDLIAMGQSHDSVIDSIATLASIVHTDKKFKLEITKPPYTPINDTYEGGLCAIERFLALTK